MLLTVGYARAPELNPETAEALRRSDAGRKARFERWEDLGLDRLNQPVVFLNKGRAVRAVKIAQTAFSNQDSLQANRERI